MITQYAIRKGRIEIDVPHNEDKLTFIYPAKGPGTYTQVAEAIDQEGLARPTLAETASILYPGFCDENAMKEPEFASIRQLMKDNWLWAFTGILYVPNEGAYIQENPEIRNRMPLMDKSELVRKLEESDPSVRHVPFGYQIKKMSPVELSKNPFIIGLAGEEGADKLAQIADKHKRKSYLWSFKSVDQETTRVSGLISCWDLDVLGLFVGGDSRGDGRYGFGFGVHKNTGEASRAEK